MLTGTISRLSNFCRFVKSSRAIFSISPMRSAFQRRSSMITILSTIASSPPRASFQSGTPTFHVCTSSSSVLLTLVLSPPFRSRCFCCLPLMLQQPKHFSGTLSQQNRRTTTFIFLMTRFTLWQQGLLVFYFQNHIVPGIGLSTDSKIMPPDFERSQASYHHLST